MIDPNEGKATEALEDEGLPEGDSPFKSTDEATVEPAEESTGEISDEAQKMADAIKPGEEEAAEGPAEDEVAKILKAAEAEEQETPNVQKRIDRLTAELKSLKAENSQLKSSAPAEKTTRYTDEQLAQAMMKAVEDQNPALVRDIFTEIRKGIKEEMVEMYTKEKEASLSQVNRIATEWDETVGTFKKYADPSIPAIWPTSHKDLNITNQTSMLYQLAMALYWNKDPDKAKYYQQSGGQKLAVTDALTYLLRTKAGKTTSTKVKKLEKQLTKERMKKSPVSGGTSGEEKSTRAPQSAEDTLAEVIAERKKYQEERGI